MADRTTANQLLSGFYGVEMDQWRWTAKDFSVALGPPPGAAKNGARLVLHLYFPDVQIQDLGPITLYAQIAGTQLAPQTFSTSGTHSYSRDVPGSVLDSNIVPVQFSFDKAAPPAPVQGRELGAVVTIVGLQPK